MTVCVVDYYVCDYSLVNNLPFLTCGACSASRRERDLKLDKFVFVDQEPDFFEFLALQSTFILGVAPNCAIFK